MGDSLHMSGSNKNLEVLHSSTNKKTPRRCLVASSPKKFLQKTYKHIVSLKHDALQGASTSQIVSFLLKVAALELVRKLSKAKCPIVWQGLQALHVFCFPPLKWIRRWAPLDILVRGMQKLSRPLLFLSIATSFTDQSDYHNEASDVTDDSQPSSPSPAGQSTPSVSICDEIQENIETKTWLPQLHKELESQGITIPERIDEDELHRFYTAAGGDFSCFLSSIKRTIRWREKYYILAAQELEMWSHLVFWHGYDVKLRPCLIIRLGLACSSLESFDRPRFTQAIVSQIEHGVLQLVNAEDPQITVLMDCEGISAFRFPMQMMRSCSVLVQDHYPNRLGSLFIIRLPPVVRVIAQTFIQVLKPVTRKKLRIEGEMYLQILSENLQMIPSFLGGQCKCDKCTVLRVRNVRHLAEPRDKSPLHEAFEDDDLAGDPNLTSELHLDGNCDQILRTAILSLLMLWVFIAFIAGMYDPDSLPLSG